MRGSSPLARGLRTFLLILGLRSGIIPARAGFTQITLQLDVWQTDHPRSRGVYVRNSVGAGRFGGSSPLARGLPYLYLQPTVR